ncbi:glycosyltransferase [Paracoccaceae bacterium]|nr:glycosyltransferase [Paracoccaceae bacterium]
MVNKLLSDLALCDLKNCTIVVRSNIEEDFEILSVDMDLIHVKNLNPAGFSSNHNRNFELKKSQYFAVLNPDLRIDNPKIFDKLIVVLKNNPMSLVCPSVADSKGEIQDSARKFPTFFEMFKRFFLSKTKKIILDPKKSIEKVDWCAGMFHLYPSALYTKMKGFDENYFLYCEDVDMGLRLNKNGYSTLICRNIVVEHDAQRDSHKRLRYFYYHIRSFLRLYLKMYLQNR